MNDRRKASINNNVVTFLIIIIIVFLIVMGIGNFVHASDKKKNKKVRISALTDVKALAILTTEEYQAVTLSAGRILHHVEAARQSIADENKKEVARHVDQALKLVEIIEAAVPKHKVTTNIKSGNISYRDEEDAALRYVDIYDEQHIEDIVTPLMQARKERGDFHKPVIEEDGTEVNGPAVELSISQHTSMKLDIIMARRMLEMAKRNLKEERIEDADDNLLMIQDNGILFISFIVDLPLVEAADNLKLAQIQIIDGLEAEALATLKLASDKLKEYGKETGENRALEVNTLSQEIDEITTSVENEKSLKTVMAKTKKQIGLWWTKTVQWMRS